MVNKIDIYSNFGVVNRYDINEYKFKLKKSFLLKSFQYQIDRLDFQCHFSNAKPNVNDK